MRPVKIWYSPYKLQPLKALNRGQSGTRPGFLLKIQSRDFEAGYADCHPWAAFGDGDVKSLLRELKGRVSSSLLKRSLELAAVDGRAREERQSLFDKKIKIKSHYTCVDPFELKPRKLEGLAQAGFSTIKIKTGRNVTREAAFCNGISKEWAENFMWRLDFNGAGGADFLERLSPVFAARIDLIEDPEPYQPALWKSLRRIYKIDVAFDHPPGAGKKVLYRGPRVIKPARQKELASSKDIITNSMDHPVGQSFAFWQAQQSLTKLKIQSRDYGLKTGHLFKNDAFFKSIADSSPYFRYSEGYGIGFNDLLEKQSWFTL